MKIEEVKQYLIDMPADERNELVTQVKEIRLQKITDKAMKRVEEKFKNKGVGK